MQLRLFFAKYADFNGRAKRPEFWWFHLFAIVRSVLLGLVHSVLPSIFSLASLLPSLAVTSRRLHDINKSGWFQLWWTLGFIINCIFRGYQPTCQSWIFVVFDDTCFTCFSRLFGNVYILLEQT